MAGIRTFKFYLQIFVGTFKRKKLRRVNFLAAPLKKKVRPPHFGGPPDHPEQKLAILRGVGLRIKM